MIKLFKFIVIGGAATLLQFFLLWVFVEFNLFQPIVASGVSYAGSAVFNYLLNYYLTFASTQKHTETLPKFIVTVAIGLTLSTALFSGFLFALKIALTNTILFDSAYLIAQLFATLLTLIVNFILHKFWIYRR